MNRFFLFLFGLFGIAAISQPQQLAYLDKNMQKTESSDYEFKRTISPTSTQGRYAVTVFYKSGNVLSEGISSVFEIPHYEGVLNSYYESGQKSAAETYKNGVLDGLSETWYENGTRHRRMLNFSTLSGKTDLIIDFWNELGEQTVVNGNGYYHFTEERYSEEGQVKDSLHHGVWKGQLEDVYTFEETFDNGKLLKGISRDKNGDTHEYTVLEQRPEPNGGMTQFYNYIAKNFKISKWNNDSGRIVTAFVVEKDGSITDIKIIQSVSKKLDAEAIRLLKECDKWQPGIQRGRTVRCTFSLPIQIKI